MLHEENFEDLFLSKKKKKKVANEEVNLQDKISIPELWLWHLVILQYALQHIECDLKPSLTKEDDV